MSIFGLFKKKTTDVPTAPEQPVSKPPVKKPATPKAKPVAPKQPRVTKPVKKAAGRGR